MATPVKDFAIVSQSIGRIQRPYEGKKVAQVYDFVDPVGMLYNFYAKRRSTYRKNNWVIENVYLTKKV
jgi:superfamily II DNA or RNA helicase